MTELLKMLENKADRSSLIKLNGDKANLSDIEHLRRGIDRIISEVDSKIGFKE
jgi:hypothetical protein